MYRVQKKALANLKQAISSLNTAPPGVAAFEIKYNHQVVADMRVALKLPRPSIDATVSAQARASTNATVSD